METERSNNASDNSTVPAVVAEIDVKVLLKLQKSELTNHLPHETNETKNHSCEETDQVGLHVYC